MRRYSFSSLRPRLLLLVLLSVVPALGLILYTALEQWRLAVAQVPEQALRLTQIISSNEERLIEGARQLLVTVARLPEVQGGESSACSRLFAELLKQHSLYANFGAIKPNGDLFCSALPTRRPLNAADRAYFQRAIKTRNFAIGDYQIGRATGRPSINFGYPIVDDAGQVRAVIYAALDLAWLNELLAEAQLPLGATLTVIDHKGTILARHPEPEKWIGKSVPEAPVAEAVLTQRGEGTAKVTGTDGIPRLYAFMRLGTAPQTPSLYVSVGIPAKTVFADVDRILVRNLIGLAIVGLLAIVAAWVAGNLFVLQPVNVLVSTAKRLSAGDLSARTGLPNGHGELSSLASAFDEMADALQTRAAAERAAETRFANIVDIAADAIIAINESQRIVLFNKGAEQNFGYCAEEVLGQPLDLLLPVRFVEAHRRHIHAFAEAPESSRRMGERREIFGRRRDGTEFPAEASISKFDQDGQTLFTVILRNITERKQVEERIQRHLERIRALHEIDLAISSTLDLRAVLDVLLEKIDQLLPLGAVTTVRLLSRESGRLEPAACRNIDEHEWSAERVGPGSGPAKRAFETKKPVFIPDVQVDAQTRDTQFARKHSLVSRLVVPLIAKEQRLGILSFYTKEEHEFTNEEIELLVTLAGQAAIAIHNAQLYEEIKSSKSELESTNQRLEKTLKELSGFYTALSPLAPAESVNQLMDAIIERLMEATGADAALIRLQNKEGGFDWATQRGFPDDYLKAAGTPPPDSALEWVFNTGEPVLAPDIASDPRLKGKVQLQAGLHSCAMLPLKIGNEPRGILHLASRQLGYFNEGQKEQLMAIARQMGIALENREHYDSLRASRDELAKAVKIKDEFLSVMSHELRTPLNVVMGYTTMVKDGILGEINPEQEKALQKVMNRARDQLAMITSILQVTQMEAGRARAECSEVELGDLLGEIRSSFDVFPDKEITLHWDYPSDLPVVTTDREKLKYILQNLVHNAIKFTDNGHVTVSARYVQGAERVEFKVADTGIGILEEKIPMIFEMFHQIDSSETRLHEGVGLGLYIVKKYTELLGGTVEVESKPGQGSTFTVTIACENFSSMISGQENQGQRAVRDEQEFIAPSPTTSNLRPERD